MIVALPPATPLTVPSDETVAIASSEELQDTFLSVALEGVIVAVNFLVSSISNVNEDSSRLTPVTATGSGAGPIGFQLLS